MSDTNTDDDQVRYDEPPAEVAESIDAQAAGATDQDDDAADLE